MEKMKALPIASPTIYGFQTIRIVKNGIDVLDSEQAKQWAGALENYTLKALNGKTEFVVDMDKTDEFKYYF